MKITILFSGGLDSLIMKRFAEVNYPHAEVNCVWFDLGQDYVEKERATLPSYVEQIKLGFTLGARGKSDGETLSGNIFIPGRNMVLASIVASLFLPDEIWLGALIGETHDNATDKNFMFLSMFNELAGYVLSPFKQDVELRFPLAGAGLNKLTATKWALEHGFTPEQLMATSSCLSGEPGNCGACMVCLRRWGIFKQLGFEEPYNRHPLTVPENLKIIQGLKESKNEDRRCEILPALEMVGFRY